MQQSKSIAFRLLLLVVAAVAVLALACSSSKSTSKPTTTGQTAVTTPSSDLSSIPEDTTGITATEIKLGSHMPLSGVAATYGASIAPAMKAYFAYINDTEGGVNGRKITFDVKDDAYDPSQTNTVVHELIEQDKVFAIVSGLGTEQHAAVFEYLKENKIPDLFTATGATMFTQPVSRTTFGYNPNYIEEGTALGKYIAKTYPDAKLGFLGQNDDFGQDGLTGIKAGIAGSKVQIVDQETYEFSQNDMTAQVQRLKNAGATVVAAYALPVQTGNLVAVARGTLNWTVPIIVSGVVADQLTVRLMNGGPNPGPAEGVVTALYLKPLETQNDAGIAKHKQIMTQYAPDTPQSNISIYGQSVAELMVAVLKKAGPNLNRRSVIAAAESIRNFTCSVCLAPINISPTDHRPIQAFQLGKVQNVNGTDGFVPFGDIISYESTK